jgi:hypothetical protein
MTTFKDLIAASPETLLKVFHHLGDTCVPGAPPIFRLANMAKSLRLHPEQLTIALGFNRALRELPDVLSVLGFASYDDLARQRNEIFINDVYNKLPFDNVMTIYATVKTDPDLIRVMQYLLHRRLQRIEARIEATVHSVLIERYRREIKAIYADGIAQIEFAEERLDKTESGFRALVKEVDVIVDHKIIPLGDIFFRASVLPEEKRRLIQRGLIPRELIVARIQDSATSPAERGMLEICLEEYAGTA